MESMIFFSPGEVKIFVILIPFPRCGMVALKTAVSHQRSAFLVGRDEGNQGFIADG